jgi:hypothetical protein
MVYINKKLFNSTAEIVNEETKYGWILLGEPIKFFAHNDVSDEEIHLTEENNLNGDTGEDEILHIGDDKNRFYDCCIAGFTPLASNVITIGNADEGLSNITYNFKGSSANSESIIYRVDTENRHNWGHGISRYGRLCLIQYNSDIKDTDEIKTQIGSWYKLPAVSGDPYLWEVGEDSRYMWNTNFYDEFVKNIVLAYDVNNSTEVNTYNFTGFSVGAASFSISGLRS